MLPHFTTTEIVIPRQSQRSHFVMGLRAIAFQWVKLVVSCSKVGASTMNCTQKVRVQLEDRLQQRSPKRLQVVADFAAYLENSSF